MEGLLAFVGVICLIAGAVSLIVPLRFLRINDRKTAVGVAIGGLVVLAVAGSMSPSDSFSFSSPDVDSHAVATSTAAGKPAPPPETSRPDLEVVEDHPATGEFGSRVVAGTIRNNTSRQYSYVQVEINLYDDAGNQLGSTLANCNNLEAGGTWKFEAPVLYDSSAQYKIKDVTGF